MSKFHSRFPSRFIQNWSRTIRHYLFISGNKYLAQKRNLFLFFSFYHILQYDDLMNSFSLINASMNIDTSKRAKGEAVTSRLIIFTRFVYMQRDRGQ